MSTKVRKLLREFPPEDILNEMSSRFTDLVELAQVATRLAPDLAPLEGFMAQLAGLTVKEKKFYFREVLMTFMRGDAVDIPMVPEHMENKVFEKVIEQTLNHMTGIVQRHQRTQARAKKSLPAPPA